MGDAARAAITPARDLSTPPARRAQYAWGSP
jgi:hypothetical protein